MQGKSKETETETRGKCHIISGSSDTGNEDRPIQIPSTHIAALFKVLHTTASLHNDRSLPWQAGSQVGQQSPTATSACSNADQTSSAVSVS